MKMKQDNIVTSCSYNKIFLRSTVERFKVIVINVNHLF